MADRKLSLRSLASKMGMNHSQLSLTFSGTRKMQLDEAAQLSQIFGEPLYKIVENAGVSVRPSSGRRVSVIGSVTGEGIVEAYAPGVIERTSAPDDLPEDSIAIQFRTSGTGLEWMDGQVSFCRPPDQNGSAAMGRFSYCKIKDGPAVMAMVRRGYVEGTYNLTGPYRVESVQIEWSSPILISRN